jgi:hypothetical protein
MPGGEPLCNVAALWVVSRRLPETSQRVAVLWAAVSISRRIDVGQNITLGNSREPPAAEPWTCNITKRLPSSAGLRDPATWIDQSGNQTRLF